MLDIFFDAFIFFFDTCLPSESRVKCGSSQLKDVDVERIRMLQEASARKAACISLLYVSLYSIMVVFEINGSDMSCSALPMC